MRAATRERALEAAVKLLGAQGVRALRHARVDERGGLPPGSTSALQTIGGLGRTALTELDGLVVHLRDPQAPFAVSAPPRLSDVDELLATPLRRSGVLVDVRVDPDLELSDAVELAVYRIAQETLTNVARHARATCASVEVRAHEADVHLRVTDDGVGPHPYERPDHRRGSGLLGIEERVNGLGGALVPHRAARGRHHRRRPPPPVCGCPAMIRVAVVDDQ